MADAAISVSGVSKRYRLYHERNQSLKASVLRGRRARYEEFWALRDVTLDIPKGQTFGLVGDNGSGKTTLLKCIARILRPDEGEIESRGKMSTLLELGAGFHPELSGRDNVYLNGSILGLSKKQITQRFDDIVGFAELEYFIDIPVKNYSSGMYVRLGFSVAINVDPDILLIDEVLAVGDQEFQRKCLEKFDQLQENGTTIVVVSHGLGAIRNLCDSAAWLDHGRLRRAGPAGEVIDEYLTEAHSDRSGDGAHGTRWGSGEALIEDVEILDASGQPVKRVRTGDTVVFRLHYRAEETIERPLWGLALFSLDGVRVSSPNTRDGGFTPEYLEAGAAGHLDFRVERLMLLTGVYDISVSLLNSSFTHVYDMRHRSFRFDVELGSPHETEGFVALGGVWEDDRLGRAP